jgi:hypothetical protein
MTVTPEIHLLRGFCTLKFGQKPVDAEAVFGAPEETQSLKDDILNTSSYVLHYWDLGFSLFFDVNKNNTLNIVEVDNDHTLLFGKPVFSLKEPELVELMKTNGYKLSDTEKHEWGEKRLSFDDAGLDCYFENGKLSTLSFSASDSPENFQYFPN